jgi:hypothetical protein
MSRLIVTIKKKFVILIGFISWCTFCIKEEKLTTYTYSDTCVCRITKLFKKTKIKITFRTSKMIKHISFNTNWQQIWNHRNIQTYTLILQKSLHRANRTFKLGIKEHIHSFIHQWLYSPLLGSGLFLSSVILFTQTVGLLGRVISLSQGCYIHTGQHKHRINAHTDIHALSGIRTNDPSMWESKDFVPQTTQPLWSA